MKFMRSTWTDSRLDEFEDRVDSRLDELSQRISDLSIWVDGLRHTMAQGFIALAVIMTTGFIGLAGLIVTQF